MKNERRTDHDGCFAGENIQEISRGNTQFRTVVLNSIVIREQARKLGIKAGERICPWDPAKVDEALGKPDSHDVDTLILKGGADPITAGDQSEYLFEKGLKPGNRALIEFPGVGHVMNHQVKNEVIEADALDTTIRDFKSAVKGSQIENAAAYQAFMREVEAVNDTTKDAEISDAVNKNRREVILSFIKSATIIDFAQNETARNAMNALGGCLRTEDKEEFLKCVKTLKER
jgi:hypothetical protein